MSLTKTKITTFSALCWNTLTMQVDALGIDIVNSIITKTIQNYFDDGKLAISEVTLTDVLDSISKTENYTKTDDLINPYSNEVSLYFDCLQIANSEIITDGTSSKESNFPLVNECWEKAQTSIVSNYQSTEKRFKSVVAKFSNATGEVFKPLKGASKDETLTQKTQYEDAVKCLEVLYSNTFLKESSRGVFEVWNLKKNGKLCRLKLYNGSEEGKGKTPPKDVLEHFRGTPEDQKEVKS